VPPDGLRAHPEIGGDLREGTAMRHLLQHMVLHADAQASLDPGN